jgi:hypothetical protein
MLAHSYKHDHGQNMTVRALGTRAEAWTTFWTSAVGVPDGAGAGELCKSVEVHSSDLRQYGAIAHDRQTSALGTEVFARVRVNTAC